MGREFWVWQWPDGTFGELLLDESNIAKGCFGHPVQLVPIGDAAQYLKEGETVAECIERNRRDADAVLELLRKAREELEAAQKEAARYRALREMHWSESPMVVVTKPKASLRLGAECPSRERLDEAIDAAIAAKEGK